MVDRAVARGDLQELVAGFHNDAVQHSIEASTRASQGSAVTAWRRYCNLSNVDWLCSDYSVKQMSQIIAGFISFEVGIRCMNPNSIKKVYLGAVNSYFGSHRISNHYDTAYKSFYVRYVLRGFLKINRFIHPLSEAKKLAFTIELVQYTDAALKGSAKKRHNDAIFIRAVKLAMKFGIYFLMRKSEYLPGRSPGSIGDRKGLPLKWIKFSTKDGVDIASKDIKAIRAFSVCINIARSKMDQYGKGRIIRHNRTKGENCIVKELENWIVWCRDSLGATHLDALFQIREFQILNDDDVADVMKRVVVHLGWDSSKVSAHSLRYGGATMLAAAGIPQYLIEYYGGWAEGSKSLALYAQVGGDAISKVSQIMAKGFNVALSESRLRASNQASTDEVGSI